MESWLDEIDWRNVGIILEQTLYRYDGDSKTCEKAGVDGEDDCIAALEFQRWSWAL